MEVTPDLTKCFFLDLVNSLARHGCPMTGSGIPSAVIRNLGLGLGYSEGGVTLADCETEIQVIWMLHEIGAASRD